MELRQLTYFIAVAEEGGFGRAADTLSIVQSAVSQQIARLERELGLRLFDRSTRHVQLTAAGHRLLVEARAVVAATDRLRVVADEVATGINGVIRLGTVHSPGDRVLHAVNRLASIAPRIQVRAHRLPPAERLHALQTGRLDAALIRGLGPQPGLTTRPIWTDPLHIALPADHPLATHPSLHLADLADLPVRMSPRHDNPPFHDLIASACLRAGFQPLPGPPFTSLHQTLAEIATGTPSWTVFYEVSGLPATSRVAIRPLADLTVTTVLATLDDATNPTVDHLFDALIHADLPAGTQELVAPQADQRSTKSPIPGPIQGSVADIDRDRR